MSSREKVSRQCWHRGQSWRWPTWHNCEVLGQLPSSQVNDKGMWEELRRNLCRNVTAIEEWATTGKPCFLVSKSWLCEKARLGYIILQICVLLDTVIIQYLIPTLFAFRNSTCQDPNKSPCHFHNAKVLGEHMSVTAEGCACAADLQPGSTRTKHCEQ